MSTVIALIITGSLVVAFALLRFFTRNIKVRFCDHLIFTQLAQYNLESSRGIVRKQEYIDKMVLLQQFYDDTYSDYITPELTRKQCIDDFYERLNNYYSVV